MRGQKAAKILVVDDSRVTRLIATRLLIGAGYDVVETATGVEALRLAKHGPELIVLDVNLPDLSGIDVCRRIRATQATRHIPVLHVSAVSRDPESKAHGLEQGADAYLSHPLHAREFLATVAALLRGHRDHLHAQGAAAAWNATFDAIQDGVCLVDAEGTVVQCNEAMTGLLKTDASGLTGGPVRRVFESLMGRSESSLISHDPNGVRRSWDLQVGNVVFRVSRDLVLDGQQRPIAAVFMFTRNGFTLADADVQSAPDEAE